MTGTIPAHDDDVPFGPMLGALPASVILLDDELRIVWANRKMEEILGVSVVAVQGNLPGDTLHCVSALATPEGCGHGPDCGRCLLRRCARDAVNGRALEQQEVKVTVETRDGTRGELAWLLSTAPLQVDDKVFAVALVQDVTVLHRLRGIVPICMFCKKIRHDADAWDEVEAFVEEHSLAQFSHGICPGCLKEHYGREPA